MFSLVRTVRRSRGGFTLVELLVVIAIIALLAALSFPAIMAVKAAARQNHCLSNMRQVGMAIINYCEARRGRFPVTAHTVGEGEQAWIYQVSKYMEDFDGGRICPDDPKAEERLKAKQTSYVMNAYITNEVSTGITNRDHLPSLGKTIMLFEIADHKTTDDFEDHVHNFNWFRQSNINKGKVLDAITDDISIDRHNGVSHYLYADGHVEAISDSQIAAWAVEPFHFSLPR